VVGYWPSGHPNWAGRAGAHWARIRRIVLANPVCGICGHWGADSVDHIVPLSKGGHPTDLANLQPAHSRYPCADCGKRCNLAKGAGSRRNTEGETSRSPLRTSRKW